MSTSNKINPAPGQAFIIEDKKDVSEYEKMGLEIPEEAQKGVGSTGVIHSVTHEHEGFFPRLKNLLFAERPYCRWKKGERVIFDKFVASDIFIGDLELKAVPLDCILGSIVN